MSSMRQSSSPPFCTQSIACMHILHVCAIPCAAHACLGAQALARGAPGWSFVFDPIHDDPTEPHWVQFYTQLLPLARSLGARVGGSQTKALGTLPGALPLPRGFARARFLTPYFQQFLVDDATAPALAPAGPWQHGAIN